MTLPSCSAFTFAAFSLPPLPRKKFKAKHLAFSLATIGLSTCLAVPASAQSNSLDTVIVTGTRARDRTVLTSTSPIDILTAEDLQRAAGSDGTLGSALQTLLPSFNLPRQSNSGGADHVRAAQLRGLSPDQVLVLVNGKRRHTTAIVNLESKVGKGTNPVDFNAIPVNAIKRIEVLRDGAGAQYGSDAIAGVINVILEDAPNGGEIQLGAGTHRTKFAPTDQRITDGKMVDLSVKAGMPLGTGGFLRGGVELSHRDATNRAGLDEIPFFENQTPENLALLNKRNYRAGDPKLEQTSLWFNSAAQFGNDIEAYGFGTWSKRRSNGAAFFRYPDSSANVSSVYPQGYLPETTGRDTNLSLSGGLKGSWGTEWYYDASLSFGRNGFDYGLNHSLNASLGEASPTSFHLGDYTFNQLTANLDATRELNFGLAKPAYLALGAELRRERFQTRPGDLASYQIGPIEAPSGAQAGPGLQPADAANVSRHVAGLYADLSAELTSSLYGSAALRWDRYSDFGSAATGKLSARYAFTPEVAARATVSSSFRAPSLAQSAFSFTVTDRGEGGILSQVRTLPVSNPIARALGATDLKAEKARNFSLGLTAQPSKGVSVSLDAYQILVDNRITLSERLGGDALRDFIKTNFGIAGVDGVNFFTNAVDTRTRGVDLVTSWETAVANGKLQLTLAASYATTRLRGERPLPAQLAQLGISTSLVGLEERNTLTTATPSNRSIFSAQWQGSEWTFGGRLTRHGATTRVFDFGDGFTPTQTYAAVWQLDLEAELRLNRQLRLAIGAVNVGDKYPTRSISDIAYFGNLPYDVLSPIGFNGAYYYARLKYAF
ncbi:MAG: TonB-dependent receptor [Burkholderiaceae bacterium]|nr:TonB-dependent receptor [Burkholderiaceae bacterium]